MHYWVLDWWRSLHWRQFTLSFRDPKDEFVCTHIQRIERIGSLSFHFRHHEIVRLSHRNLRVELLANNFGLGSLFLLNCVVLLIVVIVLLVLFLFLLFAFLFLLIGQLLLVENDGR